MNYYGFFYVKVLSKSWVREKKKGAKSFFRHILICFCSPCQDPLIHPAGARTEMMLSVSLPRNDPAWAHHPLHQEAMQSSPELKAL